MCNRTGRIIVMMCERLTLCQIGGLGMSCEMRGEGSAVGAVGHPPEAGGLRRAVYRRR